MDKITAHRTGSRRSFPFSLVPIVSLSPCQPWRLRNGSQKAPEQQDLLSAVFRTREERTCLDSGASRRCTRRHGCQSAATGRRTQGDIVVDQSLAESDRSPEGLAPEVAALVDVLKQLFDVLETSITRYAVQCRRDKGAVSRYLSGKRIPPKDFIDDLLRHAAEVRGTLATPDVQQHVHRLRLEALRVRNTGAYEVEVLRDQLGRAERELRLARIREQALLEALENREDRVRQAQQQYAQLESDWVVDRHAAEIELAGAYQERDMLRSQLSDLQVEFEALELELQRARTLKAAAEQRCVEVEVRLIAAEEHLAAERARSDAWRRQTAELADPAPTWVREAGPRIGTTLDVVATAEELCQALVPRIADAACVDLVALQTDLAGRPTARPNDNTLWKRVARACNERSGDWQNLDGREAHLRALPRSTPQGLALQTDRPVVAQAVGGELAEAIGCAAADSLLAYPLTAHGTGLGVLTLLRTPEWPPFNDADADYLSELATRAARSLDHARLNQAGPKAARELQRSMLPHGRPDVVGVQVAFRYLPADPTRVGGDWFDAIQLSDNRVGLIIGAVMGASGLRSIAVMGRFRAAVQTLMALDLPPGQILHRLDDIARGLGDDLATCLYALYDPANRTCTLANAGHAQPVLVQPDGRTKPLNLPVGTPIGAGGTPPVAQEIAVDDGSMLVLCTDGLVKAIGDDIGQGLVALCADLIGHQQHPDDACDTILARACSAPIKDDLTLLVARFDGTSRADVAT